jgi:hypothetical protein
MKIEHLRVDAAEYRGAERAVLAAMGLPPDYNVTQGHVSRSPTIRDVLQTLFRHGRTDALKMEARLNAHAFVYRYANRLYVVVPSEVPRLEDERLCTELGTALESWRTSVRLLEIQKQPHMAPFGTVPSDVSHPFAHAILHVLVVTDLPLKDEL